MRERRWRVFLTFNSFNLLSESDEGIALGKEVTWHGLEDLQSFDKTEFKEKKLFLRFRILSWSFFICLSRLCFPASDDFILNRGKAKKDGKMDKEGWNGERKQNSEENDWENRGSFFCVMTWLTRALISHDGCSLSSHCARLAEFGCWNLPAGNDHSGWKDEWGEFLLYFVLSILVYFMGCFTFPWLLSCEWITICVCGLPNSTYLLPITGGLCRVGPTYPFKCAEETTYRVTIPYHPWW